VPVMKGESKLIITERASARILNLVFRTKDVSAIAELKRVFVIEADAIMRHFGFWE
jgi:hypothetical protein